MKISVIIPVWNGSAYLPACLEGLMAQEGPEFEVIAVDNASTDGSADLIAAQYPHVRLLRLPRNRGFAGGCNAGLSIAGGELIVLLNQDTRIQPGGLARLAEAFLREPRLGVAGCKLLYPDGWTIQHAGAWIEWPLGLAHHIGRGEPDEGQGEEPRAVDYVTGAVMAIRREVLERVGPLDEGFWPGYFEDADLCYRAREAGYEIWYIPAAVAIHYETTSLRDPQARSQAYHRGRLRFVLKHLPPERWLEEFVPKEQIYLREVVASEGPGPLGAAYLAAIAFAPKLLAQRWGADRETRRRVVEALAQFYRSAWAVGGGDGAERPFALPPLSEFTFRSRVPILGPVIAGLRTLEYRVATRWAIRHLIAQQEAIHRMIEGELAMIRRSIGQLAENLVALSLAELDHEEGGDERSRGDPGGSDRDP